MESIEIVLNALQEASRKIGYQEGKKQILHDLILIYTKKTEDLEMACCDISIIRASINKIKMECYLELTNELIKLA